MTEHTPTSPRHDEDATDPVTSTLAAAALEFPHIELPPAPNFGLPQRMGTDAELADAAGLPPVVTPNVDEPPVAWRSPFPEPEPESHYALQITGPTSLPLPSPGISPWQTVQPELQPVVQQLPVAAPPAGEQPVATTSQRTTPPAMVAESAVVAEEAVIEPTGIGRGIVLVWAVLTGFLFWASGYAFSAAVMGLAALVAAELAAALSLAGGRNQPGSTGARVVAGVGIVLSLLAAKKGFAGFSAEAFVGGIFVIVAIMPSLAVFALTAVVLRRRGAGLTAADGVLQRGLKMRMLVLAAVAVAGYRAHTAWTAKPDAVVALALAALAILTALPVLTRGAAPSRLVKD